MVVLTSLLGVAATQAVALILVAATTQTVVSSAVMTSVVLTIRQFYHLEHPFIREEQVKSLALVKSFQGKSGLLR